MSAQKKPKKKPSRRGKTLSLAQAADKHAIYQRAVQSPEFDVALMQHLYRDCRQHSPYHLREDFCGTGLTLAHWAAQGERYTGEGYDIDPETTAWGLQHNFEPRRISPQQATLYIADARQPSERSPDIRCAFNFSYWVFQQRAELVDYFAGVQADLTAQGIFVIDVTGGTEALTEEPIETDVDDFKMIWQQLNFSPIDHTADLSLTFRFADGSEIDPPYHYRWRVWSIPEILDMLERAGFSKTQIWLQDTDSGELGYRKVKAMQNDPCWVACIVAQK